MDLLKTQRAEVFQVLEANGLDPSTVEWINMEHPSGVGEVPALSVKQTEFYFAFSDRNGQRIAAFSPGPETIRYSERVASWSDMLYFLGGWVQLVIREMGASDPWAALEQQKLPLVFDPDYPVAQTPFEQDELKHVIRALNSLGELLLEFAGSNKDQQKAIRAGIHRLEESAKSQDRTTFVYAVIGFIASTAVSMALAPEQTKSLFECFKIGLTGVLRLVG